MQAAWPLMALMPLALPSSGPGAGPAPSDTVDTEIRVHVKTHDAKLIGSAVGGVWITVTDMETGEVLAQGLHEGGTGDTDRIMGPARPGEALFGTEGAAGFRARVPLIRPTRVRVDANGPLGFPQALQTASATLLLIPGRDVTGDGVVLQLHGYIVEILDPPSGASPGPTLAVRARIRMLCSCTTDPGGLYPSPEVWVRLLGPANQAVSQANLSFAGEPNTYKGSLEGAAPGSYTLEVLAMSEDGTSTGRDAMRIVVH